MNSNQTLDDFAQTFTTLSEIYTNNDNISTPEIPSELEGVLDIWKKVFDNDIRVYSTISSVVFIPLQDEDNENLTVENLDLIIRNIQKILRVAAVQQVDGRNWIDFIDKIIDHIKLARIQKNQIDESIRLANTATEYLKFVVDEMNEMSLENKKTQKKTKTLNKNSKNMQKEFIAILGIFAAILIATFGGLTTLNSLFGQINTVTIDKLIFVGGFLVLSILMILFFMLNGVSKLTNLSLRSCECKENDICTCKIHKKHPTIVILTVLIASIMLLSGLPTVINLFFENLSEEKFVFKFILYALFLLLIVIFLLYILSFYNRDYVTVKEELLKRKYELLESEEQEYLKKRLILNRRIKALEKEENEMINKS